MLFGSPVFLFAFLPAVLLLHTLLPRTLRNGMLLLASLLFYAWGEPLFVLVMLLSLAGNYVLGLQVERHRGRAVERVIMALAIAFNLGLLAFFKYASFLWSNLQSVVSGLPDMEPIPLPIGISFFTFQALSYVIDVQRRDAPVQRNPIHFALYVSMFPQLIAGPIVRYRDVARQLVERVVTRAGFATGVRRFIIGLAKKLLVADTVALAADHIFALPAGELTTATAWLGTLCYTLQIYFDFSAYSDMAIGLGLMLGFRFLENFNFPYVSASITEFWRRWHMSLSSWFKDYLYIPLGGNRRGARRTYLNLVIIFFLCGLWHGASWTFVLWGLYHGAFLVVERAGLSAALARVPRVLRHTYTLLVVMVGWVLFRAETLGAAGAHLAAMFGVGAAGAATTVHPVELYLTPLVATALVAGVIGSLPVWPAVGHWREALVQRAAATGAERRSGTLDAALEIAQVLGLAVLLLASLMQLSAGTYSPFIYFRF